MLFPNPAEDIIYLKGFFQKEYCIYLRDINSKIVLELFQTPHPYPLQFHLLGTDILLLIYFILF